MSVMDTGFVSQQQEEYLRLHEPALYKKVLKKHGSFIQAKKRNNSANTNKTKNITFKR